MKRTSTTADAMKRAKEARAAKLTPEQRVLLALRLGRRTRMLAHRR